MSSKTYLSRKLEGRRRAECVGARGDSGFDRARGGRKDTLVDLKEILAAALAAVDEADVPSDLRAVAFGKAVDLVSAESSRASSENQSGGNVEENDGDVLGRLAVRLKIPRAVLEDVYYYEEGSIRLSVPTPRLARNKNAATREIALLVVAGRQAGGIDESWTSVAEVRSIAQTYNKYDPKHFGDTIQGLQDVFHIRGGPQSRELKIKQPGLEAAAELVTRLSTA